MKRINLGDKQAFRGFAYPSYFYLDWTRKRAEWRTIYQTPTELEFKKVLKWKDLKGLNITLCTNYCKTMKRHTYTDNPYTNTSFLKSALQKAVRRSDTYRAVKIGYHLFDLDRRAFLRRLAIIALEDALPLNGFNVIVWLFLASVNGYQLSEHQMCWCLGYLVRLTECKLYDPPVNGGDSESFNIAKGKLNRIPNSGKDLVYSIKFLSVARNRCREGDLHIIDQKARQWRDRYTSGPDKTEELLECKTETKFVTPPETPLEIGEWSPSAIDFHCSMTIVNNICETYDQFTEEEVKEAIWHCSSSVTNKTKIDGTKKVIPVNAQKVWAVISKKYHNVAKFLIKVRH